MEKVKYTGTITLVDGSTVNVVDDPATGKQDAQIARDAVHALKQIVYVESDVEHVIPYHAVLTADFTYETVTLPDPVDETCKEV